MGRQFVCEAACPQRRSRSVCMAEAWSCLVGQYSRRGLNDGWRRKLYNVGLYKPCYCRDGFGAQARKGNTCPMILMVPAGSAES
jgi:hypothetical protein